jgi:hypothetical protein
MPGGFAPLTLAIVAAAVVVLWVILGASGVMLRMMISVWG